MKIYEHISSRCSLSRFESGFYRAIDCAVSGYTYFGIVIKCCGSIEIKIFQVAKLLFVFALNSILLIASVH